MDITVTLTRYTFHYEEKLKEKQEKHDALAITINHNKTGRDVPFLAIGAFTMDDACILRDAPGSFEASVIDNTATVVDVLTFKRVGHSYTCTSKSLRVTFTEEDKDLFEAPGREWRKAISQRMFRVIA